MRDIKCRGWHKTSKKFEYFSLELLLELSNSGDYQGYDSCYEHYEWGQFTGLKDENGNEICEGDIVRLNYEHDDSTTYEIIWEKSGYFTLKPFIDASGFIPTLGWFTDSEEGYSIEIIGNIYEHKHLLEGK